jgi:hypothetical protein
MNNHHKNQHRSISERNITVTMLDDVNTTTHATFVNVYNAPQDESRPALVEGFHLPNRFRVEGLNYSIELEVAEIHQDGRRFFGCTSLLISPKDESASISKVEPIPVATMVKLAVKCSRSVCVYYPAHYEGALLDHKLRAVNATIKVDETPYVEPVKLSPPKGKTWTDDAVNKLIGKQPRKLKSSWTDEFLQEVANVYNSAPTFPRDAVMQKWKLKHRRTADNWIAECRKQGLITPTKKRATK